MDRWPARFPRLPMHPRYGADAPHPKPRSSTCRRRSGAYKTMAHPGPQCCWCPVWAGRSESAAPARRGSYRLWLHRGTVSFDLNSEGIFSERVIVRELLLLQLLLHADGAETLAHALEFCAQSSAEKFGLQVW